MNGKTYDILKRIFSVLPIIGGALVGIGKILDNSMMITVGAIIGVISSAGLEYLGLESKKYFSDKDIVPSGHITFINLELHEGEDDPDPIPADEEG